MLKRVGRGNSLCPVAETNSGELAVLCPACPQPGVNLPDDWEKDEQTGYRYWLTRAYDACFRLKHKLLSSDAKDLGLGTGWSYFVENEPYKEFTNMLGDQSEVSSVYQLQLQS